MCGIAGAVDLVARRTFPQERLLQMTGALAHRGPDDEQFHIEPGVALGVRRLAIIDIAGGRQPISNEAGDVWVAYEGELYEYPELREHLKSAAIDSPLAATPRLGCTYTKNWANASFARRTANFRLPFGMARRKLLLGRDRVGIGPLFYAQHDGWLLWSSEIKGLLASGLIAAEPDIHGIDYFFNFFSMPNERTCFANIRQIPPGHYAVVKDGKLDIDVLGP